MRTDFRSFVKLLTLPATLTLSGLALAAAPSAIEPVYSEVLSAYRTGDYLRTLQLLNKLLEKTPDQAEYLELKAQSLKKSGCPECAQSVFEQLNKLRKEGRATVSDATLSSQFELAALQLKQGKIPEAQRLLEPLTVSGSAAPAAQFFLGTIAIRSQKYREAAAYFKKVTASDAKALRPAAALYLARIHLMRSREQDIPAAIRELRLARDLSSALIDSPGTAPATVDTSTETYAAAVSLLSTYDNSGFFGLLTILAGYDSNVLAVPTSQATLQTTGAGSMTTALQAGVGYSSSPVRTIQFVSSYRGSFNYNLNGDTKLGDFLVHDFSLTMTKDALAQTSYGLRLEGVYTFQNQVATDSGSSAFKPYSYQLPIGPFFKTPIGAVWSMGAELSLMPHHEFGDSASADEQKRSGMDITTRLSLSESSPGVYWNPTFTLSGGMSATDGTEYDATFYGGEFRNLLHLTDRIDAFASAGLISTSYGNRALGTRSDKLILLGASLVDRISPNWSLLGTLQLFDNLSNETDLYAYTRFAFSAGATYNF